MLVHILQRKLRYILRQTSQSPWHALLVGLMALGATLSMSIPFAPILVFAVLLQPKRWLWLVITASLGSALGGVGLYVLFHHLGWQQLLAKYPELVHGRSWQEANHWLGHYGARALCIISATPLPDTPALAYAAMAHLPKQAIFGALWLGKFIKYSLYAGTAVYFPERLSSYFHTEPL